MADKAMTKILIFGGNGFLGGETVVELLALNTFDITVVNRGNWKNYDSNIRIRPFVKAFNIDRESSTAVEQLHSAIGNEHFDAVIDFSAYDTDVVKDALKVLEDKIKLYIYISTDSVYEVCLPSNNDLASETDSIRPLDNDEYERFRRKDSYGHKKLKIEEVLFRRQSKSNNNWSYVILRLPDVLGPRDSTDRWWFYQMWIQFYSSIQKPLETSTQLRSSYVYVNDVARYITYILSKTFLDSSTIFHNQIFNIGCTEIISIQDLLTLIIDELNLNSLHIPIQYNPNTEVDFFPSVTRGGINISKALSNEFNWKPTPIKQVVRETIQWYNDAYGLYPNDRSDIVKRIRRTLLKNNESAYGKFLYEVNQYATQSTIKRKRVEEEKKIVAVDSLTVNSDHGDYRQEKLFKHSDM
ncbi:unnamed protein product [Rotaria socialis]|uniref:NAD-dependent epimerase/dehydratase domain-containing protein n=1 Tax=Rotaria socialis TaxID=392032 RepID=A0A820QHL1_9BILA|nr:unnamed protein product [Rotaria socialis]CAF3489845.1 unnamed protein product [Rotaria socialis]CAF4419059.1 unnamed protein product [Rotaria socialis]CAF4489410.1 unnamed protein product [Rotaria socialis]